jgi:hypothetical protein
MQKWSNPTQSHIVTLEGAIKGNYFCISEIVSNCSSEGWLE